jgi:hypothetical protein
MRKWPVAGNERLYDRSRLALFPRSAVSHVGKELNRQHSLISTLSEKGADSLLCFPGDSENFHSDCETVPPDGENFSNDIPLTNSRIDWRSS